MRPTEALLHYQRLGDRLRSLHDERDHLLSRLASNPELDAATAGEADAQRRREAAARRVRELDDEAEAHRGKMRAHERELMSGRIRSPSDLTRMSEEVEHMKARLAAEEDRELDAMVELEEAEKEHDQARRFLDQVRRRTEADAPGMQTRVERLEGEAAELEAEIASVWALVPAGLQTQYRKLSRLANPVVPVVDGQCTGCHVQLTANELQQLKRGERSTCQNCNRILVLE
jgi:predicted CXXCH cytochrome family protein